MLVSFFFNIVGNNFSNLILLPMKIKMLFVGLELKDVETVGEKIKGELVRKKIFQKSRGISRMH